MIISLLYQVLDGFVFSYSFLLGLVEIWAESHQLMSRTVVMVALFHSLFCPLDGHKSCPLLDSLAIGDWKQGFQQDLPTKSVLFLV